MIAAVLVGIFFAATGRGGELAYEQADHAPLDLGPVSAADIALLRPPTAMWGYNMQVTDEALDHIARAMRERDVTIAYLQEQLAGYEGNGSYSKPKGAHARQDLDAPLESELPPFGGFTWTTEAAEATDAPDVPAASEFPAAPELPAAAEFPAAPELPAAAELPTAPELPRGHGVSGGLGASRGSRPPRLPRPRSPRKRPSPRNPWRRMNLRKPRTRSSPWNLPNLQSPRSLP